LDSLVRIEPFQWVALDFRKKKILAPFSAPGALGRARASGQSQSAALLKPRAYLISDYLH
jgi:hypothetical protein